MPEHSINLSGHPDAALAALRRAADDWGAELRREGAEQWLHLPVVHGLKRGRVSGPVRVDTLPEGTRVVFSPAESDLYTQPSSVLVLLMAIAGALVTLLWPFFPRLLPVSPFGAILALGGWFLVLSRLRTSGPDEFLVMVAAQAARESPDPQVGYTP
jgi:hypothetical protein